MVVVGMAAAVAVAIERRRLIGNKFPYPLYVRLDLLEQAEKLVFQMQAFFSQSVEDFIGGVLCSSFYAMHFVIGFMVVFE